MFRRRYQRRRRFGLRSVRRRRFLKHPSWRKRFGAATSSFRRKFSRRSFKKHRFSIRRRSFRRKGSFAAKVIKATEPTRTAVATYQQEHKVPGLVIGAVPCVYFACEQWGAAATKDTVISVELFDILHMGKIFDLVTVGTAAGNQGSAVTNSSEMWTSNRQRVWVSGTMVQTLRNQATEPVRITAYYCKPRQNLTFSDTQATSSVYWWLSTGFANNGIDPGSPSPTTNDAMTEDEYSPFQALDFTRDFKITKVKKFSIQPGQFRKLAMANKRGFVTTPIHLFTPAGNSGGTNWILNNPKYQIIKQGRFILYKMTGSPAGYGGVEQGTYSKLTQTTSPAIVMRTNFKYKFRSFYARWSPAFSLDFSGIAANGVVPPAIVVPDAASTGVVSNAY